MCHSFLPSYFFSKVLINFSYSASSSVVGRAEKATLHLETCFEFGNNFHFSNKGEVGFFVAVFGIKKKKEKRKREKIL